MPMLYLFFMLDFFNIVIAKDLKLSPAGQKGFLTFQNVYSTYVSAWVDSERYAVILASW